MAKIRVLIADDHGVVRAGLQLLVNAQPDLEVVGQAGTVHEALEQTRLLEPDVICLDVSLPDGSGISAIKPLRAACPGVKVLILTVHGDASYAHAALAAGAHGFVSKTAADTELLSAIRAVHHDRTFIDLPSRAGQIAGALDRPEASGTPLSQREREVFELLARGHTNQEVADRLHLSVKTVETYRARIVEKLGLRNRADFVRYAVEMGLLRASGEAPDPPFPSPLSGAS
jgi:DNA-binding NarL/FixJ family response regulator